MTVKKHLREPIRSLEQAEMEILHQNALRILAEVGMRIDHDEALETLHLTITGVGI